MSLYDELVALDAGHGMQTYARLPVVFVRGEGTRLWDSEGREYLDFLAGLAVTSLGHAHPVVAEAIAAQAGTLCHVSNLYHNDIQPRLAATIDGLLGGGGRVFFANSGAEANECAIKLARRFGQKAAGPERFHVVSTLNSFHGRTLSTLAATGQPAKQAAFQPLPSGFSQVPFADLGALEAEAARLGDGLAAVLVEAVQAEGGVWVAPPGYLEGVRALCDRTGALLLLDEVQAGLGRTGRWFGFEHSGIRPDVVSLAKALGNGMPIGACWARAEVAVAFDAGDHATTYGGQPLAASAALATLEVMQAEDVPERAAGAGARLAGGLEGVPGVASVRGLGLLLAAELAAPDGAPLDARAAAAACLERGLVVNAVTGTALRFTPPLLVTEAEVDEAVAITAKALAAVS
ncbi:MAG: acetylornithine/succinylornithine family transaminase [Acidimicrobiia bacterium]